MATWAASLDERGLDVLPPAAVAADIRCALENVGFADESGYHVARCELDPAQAQGCGNLRDEGSHLFRQQCPDFHFDGGAVCVDTNHSRPAGWPARQSE